MINGWIRFWRTSWIAFWVAGSVVVLWAADRVESRYREDD